MKYISFLLTILLFISCTDDSTEHRRVNNNQFKIYLVIPGDESFYREEVDLELLQLEEKPWVQSTDIEFYDWSAHTFYLNKAVEKGKLSARNFVVTSGEKRLFVGVFWPMYMSSIPMIPAVMPEDDWFNPKDVIRFNSFGWHLSEGLEDNLEFKSELIKAGLYQEGIEVDIIYLRRRNSSILEYTIKVTNLDSEKIYILDPVKMGAPRFHYYTNGVGIVQDDKYYWPQDFTTTASDGINSGWYYKLLPGKSMTRKVIQDGYQNLPTGKVKASFSFPGAYYLKEKEWKKSDGRIWIGDFRVEKELTLN
jgi:hypothetical protein